jgi:hypothetical protein
MDNTMILIMIVSGFLSIMSVWADKTSDIRISLNDIYMVTLMIGWMLIFSGIYHRMKNNIIVGFIITLITFLCIRKQYLVTEKQYIKGMIPHHSMAILMSKKLKDKGINNKELEILVDAIIKIKKKKLKY